MSDLMMMFLMNHFGMIVGGIVTIGLVKMVKAGLR